MQAQARYSPLRQAGLVIGLGVGGFVDGILLHQVLQWHHMLTSAGYPPDSVANLQVNTLWDGLFHVGTLILTVVGIAMLWRVGQRRDAAWSGRVFVGAVAMGWGIFNLVEGIIDHHILGIHHVRSGPDQLAYDLGFLALGAALLVGGWLLARARPELAPRPT